MNLPSHVDAATSVTSEEFREVVGHFATGVTVISAAHGGQAYGTTASAVTSLSLDPPMMLICMNRSSETGIAVAHGAHFAINILRDDQLDIALRFARKGEHKFAGLDTRPGLWGQPLLSEALAAIECRVVETTTGGTHSVFIAEVMTATAGPGAPLAYYKGRFGQLHLQDLPTQNV